MRFALVSLAALLSCTIAGAQSTDFHRPVSDPNIVLKIVPEGATIRAGEKLKIRVELWNTGPKDVIVAQDVAATFGNSELQLFLRKGTVEEAQWGLVADGIPTPNPDFEETFVKNWLTLNSGHFYGTYVHMDPIEFPYLRKPGHYKLRAEYYSRGISSYLSPNGGYLKQADIDRLPLAVLKGTIESNIVTIEVKPRDKSNPR